MKKAIFVLAACLFCHPASAQWQQWGGPTRDFGVESKAELPAWGELGPKVIWLREIGPGYSAIVVDSGRLFTMTRDGAEEVIVALSAADGGELWRHAYAAPTAALKHVDSSYGDAPQSTPLMAGGRVYGFGFTGVLSAVEAASGKPVWSADLAGEHGAGIPYFGHASSPLQVGDSVVVIAGGAFAFDLVSGEVRWSNRDFEATYASPILAPSPAGEQLVVAAAGEVVGLSPEDGRLLWRHEHANQHRTILSTPVVGSEGTLFVSAYFLGSIGLRFGADGRPTELWQRGDVQVSQTNALTFGSMVVASHNRNLVALDLPSGRELWREKGLRRSNLVRVGSRALLLGDQGGLTLAELGRDGMRSIAEAQILEGRSWTAPTVAGHRLFARNTRQIIAVDLAVSARAVAESAAGLRERGEPTVAEAPAAFVRAAGELEAAALARDPEALARALESLELQATPELAAHRDYYRGFAAWQRSVWGPEAERLGQVDRGVEALRQALEHDQGFVEAHALLARLYSAYYRLAPRRAGVIGPLGDEHLDRALQLAPQNPRVVAIHGLDLLYSPPRYGGDPERGKARLEEAIRLADAESPADTDPRPRWLAASARVWLATSLLGGGETGEASKLLQQALGLAPHFAEAKQLLESAE